VADLAVAFEEVEGVAAVAMKMMIPEEED